MQFLMLIQSQVLCYQYKVGDLDAWGIPTSANPQVYIKWSKYHQFKLGDSFLFLYPPSQDSVIQVTAQSYGSCNLKDPILSMNDGNLLIVFLHKFRTRDQEDAYSEENAQVQTPAAPGSAVCAGRLLCLMVLHLSLPHLHRRERNVSAEGNTGAREVPSPRQDLKDPRAIRRCKGHGEEPTRAAPSVPGHGGADACAGGADRRHRKPHHESQLVRG
ncbi:hypothetical protein ACFX11_003050 [Malus domestica]